MWAYKTTFERRNKLNDLFLNATQGALEMFLTTNESMYPPD